jgi:hypothetical protein
MVDEKQIIEIRDPDINVEEIMNRVRERVRQRREQASAQGLDYDKLAEAGAAAGRLPADLYYELNLLCTNADAIGVSLAMRDRRLPFLNFLFFRIENLLHRLVVKYVNLMAGRQITLNRSTAHVLSGLTHALEERDARIDALEERVTELEDRLSRTEPSASK